MQCPLDSGLHSRVYPRSIWRTSRTAYKQPFRLANSQSALLSVSMPFGSMSDASSCCQPPAAQAAFAFTPPTPLSACASRRMQGLGFSLQEIKELMGVRGDRAHACSAVRQFLKTKLADVAVRIRDLQQLETELQADLQKCNRALKQQRGKTCACPVLEGEERTNA